MFINQRGFGFSYSHLNPIRCTREASREHVENGFVHRIAPRSRVAHVAAEESVLGHFDVCFRPLFAVECVLGRSARRSLQSLISTALMLLPRWAPICISVIFPACSSSQQSSTMPHGCRVIVALVWLRLFRASLPFSAAALRCGICFLPRSYCLFSLAHARACFMCVSYLHLLHFIRFTWHGGGNLCRKISTPQPEQRPNHSLERTAAPHVVGDSVVTNSSR